MKKKSDINEKKSCPANTFPLNTLLSVLDHKAQPLCKNACLVNLIRKVPYAC